MKTIWKFEIPLVGSILMPQDARILSVGNQGRTITAWALVDSNAPSTIRRLIVYGTGHRIEEQSINLPFIGTVFIDDLVLHIFDGGEA